ncbi:MAG: HTH-type transcriptional activator CmpR [Desulfovibrio sp.]
MDEKDWIILKILQEKRSITKTAAAVYISQPALSKRLRQIEERFGVTIAHRNKTGIELTPAGEYLAACAQELIEKMRIMTEYVNNMGEEVKGTLRIGASYFCTKYALPDLLMTFKESFPSVELQVESDWSSEIIQKVTNGDLHIGFVRNDSFPPEERHLLFQDKMFICSSKPLDLARLPEEPQINYKSDVLVRAELNLWWAEHYSRPPRVAMVVDRISSSASMVAKGLGWAFLSEFTASLIPGIHKYPLRHKDGSPYFRHTWLIWNRDAKQLKSVTSFIDFAKSFSYPGHPDPYSE